jgi:hypothetical protein
MSKMPDANQYRRQNRPPLQSDSMGHSDRQTDSRHEQQGDETAAGGLGVAIIVGLALLARIFLSK